MSSSENTWPPPDYDVGPPEHVHAIGVIALTYAKLQGVMDRLFLDSANSEWADKYYYMLSEDKRSDAIREMFKHFDPGVVSAIDNLTKHFDWCRACRNNLLHAESYPSDGVPFPDGALALTKPLKKGSLKPGYMALTLPELRGPCRWALEIDTNIDETQGARVFASGQIYGATGRSLLLFARQDI